MNVMQAAPRQQPAATLEWMALTITFVAAATIGAVWAMQAAGYTPCELCLLERDPFYASLPVGLATLLAARLGRRRIVRLGFGLLTLIFVSSAVLAAYHVGVEWTLWAGPAGCTGATQAPAAVGDFLKQLDSVKVVRCDAAALRIMGLSLAGWNVIVSLALVGLGVAGVVRASDRALSPAS